MQESVYTFNHPDFVDSYEISGWFFHQKYQNHKNMVFQAEKSEEKLHNLTLIHRENLCGASNTAGNQTKMVIKNRLTNPS